MRSDHKSISFLKNCKINHGRLTRWILALQEYHINWEYVSGKQNIAADILSRINIEQQTFEGEKETIVKVYTIIKNKSDLENTMKSISQQQTEDTKINNFRQRLIQQNEKITAYYCLHEDILFYKPNNNQGS